MGSATPSTLLYGFMSDEIRATFDPICRVACTVRPQQNKRWVMSTWGIWLAGAFSMKSISFVSQIPQIPRGRDICSSPRHVRVALSGIVNAPVLAGGEDWTRDVLNLGP
jgi:hypothetical protein